MDNCSQKNLMRENWFSSCWRVYIIKKFLYTTNLGTLLVNSIEKNRSARIPVVLETKNQTDSHPQMGFTNSALFCLQKPQRDSEAACQPLRAPALLKRGLRKPRLGDATPYASLDGLCVTLKASCCLSAALSEPAQWLKPFAPRSCCVASASFALLLVVASLPLADSWLQDQFIALANTTPRCSRNSFGNSQQAHLRIPAQSLSASYVCVSN